MTFGAGSLHAIENGGNPSTGNFVLARDVGYNPTVTPKPYPDTVIRGKRFDLKK